jgi:hypothetical protein
MCAACTGAVYSVRMHACWANNRCSALSYYYTHVCTYVGATCALHELNAYMHVCWVGKMLKNADLIGTCACAHEVQFKWILAAECLPQ